MAQEKENRNNLRTILVLAFVLLIILLLLRFCNRCNRHAEPLDIPVDSTLVDTVYVHLTDTVYLPMPEDTVVEGVYDEVDMVMCIDVTGSMSGIIRTVTNHAVNFCDDLKRKCEENGKSIGNFRVRVLAFRDFEYSDFNPLEDSGFFILPDQGGEFRNFCSGLRANGGGDDPESGLEALGVAINSAWSDGGRNRCRVIMLWTDVNAKNLGRGRRSSRYPADLPTSLEEMQSWWETEKMGGGAKRLVLFAPRTGHWNTIEEQWSDVSVGNYNNPDDYDAILQTIVDAL